MKKKLNFYCNRSGSDVKIESSTFCTPRKLWARKTSFISCFTIILLNCCFYCTFGIIKGTARFNIRHSLNLLPITMWRKETFLHSSSSSGSFFLLSFESAEKLDEAKLTEKFFLHFNSSSFLLYCCRLSPYGSSFCCQSSLNGPSGAIRSSGFGANRNWYFCWWEIERESIKAAANESHPGRTWETLLTTSWQRQDW